MNVELRTNVLMGGIALREFRTRVEAWYTSHLERDEGRVWLSEKIHYWIDRDSNLGPPSGKTDALTTIAPGLQVEHYCIYIKVQYSTRSVQSN